MSINQRGTLREEPFSYQADEENLFIFWEGKRVEILEMKEALRVLERLEQSISQGAQLSMAKLTGNFKRGNERK